MIINLLAFLSFLAGGPVETRSSEQNTSNTCAASYVELGSLPGSRREICIQEDQESGYSISGVYPDALVTVPECSDPSEHAFPHCFIVEGFLNVVLPNQLHQGASWSHGEMSFFALDPFCIDLKRERRCYLPVSVYDGDTPLNMLFFSEGEGLVMFYKYFAFEEQTVAGDSYTRYVPMIFVSAGGGLFPSVY